MAASVSRLRKSTLICSEPACVARLHVPQPRMVVKRRVLAGSTRVRYNMGADATTGGPVAAGTKDTSEPQLGQRAEACCRSGQGHDGVRATNKDRIRAMTVWLG